MKQWTDAAALYEKAGMYDKVPIVDVTCAWIIISVAMWVLSAHFGWVILLLRRYAVASPGGFEWGVGGSIVLCRTR